MMISDELPGLENGWIFGAKMDLYDHQWKSFRQSLPMIIPFAAVFIFLVHFARARSHSLLVRTLIVLGCLFVYVLHGFWFVHILALTSISFFLSKLAADTLSSRLAACVIWIFNLFMMVFIPLKGSQLFVPEFLRATQYQGMQSWTPMYHMLVLKFISFGMDYIWALNSVDQRHDVPARLDYKSRQNTNLPIRDYSFSNFLAYIFYVPLYIGGPIISFNAFVSQLKISQTAYTFRELISYGIFRLGLIFLLMEVFLHSLYSNAITASQSESILSRLQPFSLAFAISLFTLLFMWMKFLLIWRTSRFWSLACGIEAPENMNRCVMNNYSMIQFWRDWHSSYNIWLVRYIYIPLGGSRTSGVQKIFNIFLVFFFVAVWHDPEWRYIHWAWIVILAIIPESLCRFVFYETKFGAKYLKNKKCFSKFILTLGGALNVLFMMSANLVGYVYGLEGLSILSTTIHNSPIYDIALTLVFIYIGVGLMYILEQYREKK